MIKSASVFSVIISVMICVADFAHGADGGKYSVINIWEPGSYNLRQDAASSMITSIDKEVVTRVQTQVSFFWKANVENLKEDGSQKMTLQTTRIIYQGESGTRDASFFDSSNSRQSNDFVQELFQRFMKANVSLTFKNGEIDNFEVNEVWEGFTAKNDSDRMLLEQFRSVLTKDAFTQFFDPFSWASTPAEIALAQEWKNKISRSVPLIEMDGDLDLEWSCRLDSVKKDANKLIANVVARSRTELTLDESMTAEVNSEIKAGYVAETGSPHDLEVRTTVNAVRQADSKNASDLKIVELQRNKLQVVKH